MFTLARYRTQSLTHKQVVLEHAARLFEKSGGAVGRVRASESTQDVAAAAAAAGGSAGAPSAPLLLELGVGRVPGGVAPVRSIPLAVHALYSLTRIYGIVNTHTFSCALLTTHTHTHTHTHTYTRTGSGGQGVSCGVRGGHTGQ